MNAYRATASHPPPPPPPPPVRVIREGVEIVNTPTPESSRTVRRRSRRRPAAVRPNLPRTGKHTGPLAGICAIVIVCAMIFLSLLSLDRHAATVVGGQGEQIAVEVSK